MPSYEFKLAAMWQGSQRRFSDAAKNQALAGVLTLAKRATMTREGIEDLARQIHQWFVRNHHRVLRGTVLEGLKLTISDGPKTVAVIDLTDGQTPEISTSCADINEARAAHGPRLVTNKLITKF